MPHRVKLRLLAPMALLAALSAGLRVSAAPSDHTRVSASHAPTRCSAQRCPICGGNFEEFKRKYFYVVRESVRLVARIAS